MRHAQRRSRVNAEAPEPLVARHSIDLLLRTQQQTELQLSAMADGKANIILTITSVVLTVSVTQLGSDRFRETALVGSAFALIALVLAVLAVLPRGGTGGRAPRRGNNEPSSRLFFGHAASVSAEQHWVELRALFTDDEALYRAVADGLHAQALVLAHKYRYLRASYVVFLAGAVTAAMVGVLSATMG